MTLIRGVACAIEEEFTITQRLRILVWPASYPPGVGGVEMVASDLARGLAAAGHELQVVTQSPGAERATETAPEGVVHRLPFHQALDSRDPSRVAALTSEVLRIRRRFAADVVHVHATHPSLFFLLRTDHAGPSPTLATLHGWTTMASGDGSMRTRLLRRADWMTGVSRYVVERATSAVPGLAARASVVHPGCPDPGIPPAPLPFEPARIVCVARLVERKGVDTVLRALPAVLDRVPGTRLRIVGDGSERARLERDAAALGVAAQTEFAGEVSGREVFRHLNASTVFVLVSRGGTEGLAIAAVEAALMERPVIASRNGGLPETLVDGTTGLLVQSDDPAGLAERLVRVLEDRALAIRMGRAGRAHVLERFDPDAQIASYERLYRRLAEGGVRR